VNRSPAASLLTRIRNRSSQLLIQNNKILMTKRAYSDLRELRKIGAARENPAIRFKSVWARKPKGAAKRQYDFEQECAQDALVI